MNSNDLESAWHNCRDAVLELCCQLTLGYDYTHNLSHHLKVLHDAESIMNRMATIHTLSPENWARVQLLVRLAAALHDTIDYKYTAIGDPPEVKRQKLERFLVDHFASYSSQVLWIIDNISYSKETKTGYPVHTDDVVQLARDITSDADKLDAIGSNGFYRCREFTQIFNPCYTPEEINRRIVEHADEKLLLLKDSYIRTIVGKQMAQPLHDELVVLVDEIRI